MSVSLNVCTVCRDVVSCQYTDLSFLLAVYFKLCCVLILLYIFLLTYSNSNSYINIPVHEMNCIDIARDRVIKTDNMYCMENLPRSFRTGLLRGRCARTPFTVHGSNNTDMTSHTMANEL